MNGRVSLVRLKLLLAGIKPQLPAWALSWCLLCLLIAPVTANETIPDDSKTVAYIHCAVDFDMFGKILKDTPAEDKIRLFGEAVVALEDKSISFFKNGSDFFVIQAVNLSSRENVANVARQRFERITAGFESDHQAQLERIIANGYRCVELLSIELENIRNGEQAD